MEMEMEMEQFLPIEIIITEILSRLPVDSVIQCKCVCKTWRSRIDDPAFADVHTHRLLISMSSDQKSSVENHSNSSVVSYDSLFLVRGWLSYQIQYGYQYQYRFVEYNDDNRITLKPSTNKSLLPFPLESLGNHWQVSSSCNGLIFMFSDLTKDKHKHMIVCNPCTREYVNLVPNLSNTTTSRGNHSEYYTFVAAEGFGYHPHTKEYKIVIITYRKYFSGQLPVPRITFGQVMVYTLGSGRWRSKGKLPNLRSDDDSSEMILKGTGVLVNGVLHWILEKPGKVIVLFDLEDEEFRVVLAPPSPPGSHLDSVELYAGCLCVTRSNYISGSLDIWVTKNKEYSWIWEFSIPWNHEEKLYGNNFLGCLKGGKILLGSILYHWLVSYDPETDSFEKIKNGNSTDGFKWSSCLPYKKTFVSLKALGEKDTKYVML